MRRVAAGRPIDLHLDLDFVFDFDFNLDRLVG